MPDLDGTVLIDDLDFDVGEKNLNIWRLFCQKL